MGLAPSKLWELGDDGVCLRLLALRSLRALGWLRRGLRWEERPDVSPILASRLCSVLFGRFPGPFFKTPGYRKNQSADLFGRPVAYGQRGNPWPAIRAESSPAIPFRKLYGGFVGIEKRWKNRFFVPR